MVTGLVHGHQGLAYLVLLSSGISLVLAIVNAATGPKPGLIRLGTLLGRRVEPALMGIIALLGLAAGYALGLPLHAPILWIGIVMVVLQGAVVGMLTKPALTQLAAGDASAKQRWVGAALANALIVGAAFMLMRMY